MYECFCIVLEYGHNLAARVSFRLSAASVVVPKFLAAEGTYPADAGYYNIENENQHDVTGMYFFKAIPQMLLRFTY